MGMGYMQDWLLRCSSPVVHAVVEWDSPNTATQEHTVRHRQGHWGRKYICRLVSGSIINSFTWRSVTNVSLENNLPTFWLKAPVIIRAKVKRCEQMLLFIVVHNWGHTSLEVKGREDCSFLQLLITEVQQPGTSSPLSRLKHSFEGVIWMCRASFTTIGSHLFTFGLMETGAFSWNIGKLSSKLKLVTDNLLFIYAEANWEVTESSSLPCLHTFRHAILLSLYISFTLLFLYLFDVYLCYSNLRTWNSIWQFSSGCKHVICQLKSDEKPTTLYTRF